MQYLHGTKDRGLFFTPSSTLQVGCYADADFSGLWQYEDGQDPVSMKSWTEYIIIFGGCPFEMEIALFTTEAEDIALSQSMRD